MACAIRSRHEHALKNCSGSPDHDSKDSTPRPPNLQKNPIEFPLVAPGRSRPSARDLGRLLRHGFVALIVSIAGMPAAFGEARAQEASRPLEFEVRPSGVEPETPEARLDRRLKQREYLFRSICIQCGPGDRFQSNAPFNPYQALRRPASE
jgi:hypothetical protein